MYHKVPKGILKHLDFILLDLLCLELSFYISYLIRKPSSTILGSDLYTNMLFVLIFAQVMVAVFFDTFKNVLKRGYYLEFVATLKNVCLIMLLSMAYLYIIHRSQEYSRFVWFFTGILYFILGYSTRLGWKSYLKKRTIPKEKRRSLIVITSKNSVKDDLQKLKNNNYQFLYIAGIMLYDDDRVGDSVEGIPVVANIDNFADYICRNWVDEVLIVYPSDTPNYEQIIDKIVKMGITVHINLIEFSSLVNKKRVVENINSYTVLTLSINMARTRHIIIKRFIDICAGLVGCIITAILFVVIGPIIYIQSPGPVFFAQERIGKNGRKFKLYKFRSMYMDAEERKKELMSQNKIKDGMMFKMENDPRIIGSEKGKGKGIGNFIRKTSIDEFPQFWNVLKGDMSLVGTRPPTLDEWNKYDLHHRARLAIKPGITGMWQTNGRSSITDFEEVVRLDTEYIEKWSLGLDIKLILKTILVVFNKKGSL